MNIYSKPDATTFYKVELPEIQREFWTPQQKILENEYIATSTAPAGVFRQLVKYDVSSIARSYSIVIDQTRATVIKNMIESTQTSFHMHNGSAAYEVYFTAQLSYIGNKVFVQLQISVIQAVV